MGHINFVEVNVLKVLLMLLMLAIDILTLPASTEMVNNLKFVYRNCRYLGRRSILQVK